MVERPVPEGLIPHRGPALLVHTIVETGPDAAVCRGRIPAESAFVTDGRAPAVLAIELAAQAAAVQQAMAARTAGVAKPGYLVGVRDAALQVDDVRSDVTLVATVRRVARAGPLATYEVSVTGPGGEQVLTATLSTHAGD
jgi:predicted hotdog family 3-hydroxylacyl-ACP dehydratase